ncbi:MAG: hypothetical protein ABR585_07690 [Gemmatimonadaceae bacterium]
MPDHKIRISGGQQGYTVLLDDQDITAALHGISITIPRPGVPASVVLKGAINSINIEPADVDVQVGIPDSAKRLMEHLGWTPPVSESEVRP